MRNSVVLKLLLLSLLAVSGLADATTVQVTASVESSRYLEGTNLTDDSISASLAADWSFKQGGFVGFDCYTSTVDISEGLNNGCDIYAGYFKPINQNNAVSVQLTRHEYSQGIDHKWDFSDIATSWHPSKTTSFTATYSKNWLNRPFDAYAIKAETQIPIVDKLNFHVSGSVMALESGAPVDVLTFGKASLSYTHGLWVTEVGAIYTDPDQRRMVPFDIDEPELLLTLSYRLY